MLIAITYDLRVEYLAAGYGELETAEFDRPDTIDALAGALETLGHTTVRVGNIRALAGRLVAGERWDLVFNICEGLSGYGRESQVPALLEAYDVPYVFSDPLAFALTLHKGMAKHVLRDNGVATPDFALVSSAAEAARVRLPLPLFAKPVAEGTGKGIDRSSRIESYAQLRRVCAQLLERYTQPVLVETYLPGREFTVGIIGTGADATAVGTMEVLLRGEADQGAYTYRNKEHCEALVSYVLLRERVLRRAVEAAALAAWRCTGCRDAGRVDLRLDAHGKPHVLELNPLAGLHPEHSDLPILCGLAGMAYPELIERILQSAMMRIAKPALRRSRIAGARA